MTRETKITEALGGLVQFRVGGRFDNERASTMVHDREYLPFEGRLAVQLLERFGMIAGRPDGEDSAGRRASALLSPQEAVTRSVEMASLMAKALREKGLVVLMPPME